MSQLSVRREKLGHVTAALSLACLSHVFSIYVACLLLVVCLSFACMLLIFCVYFPCLLFSLSPSPGPKDLVPEVKLEMTKGKNAGLRAIHKEQTASRRSQPSSRIASKGELSFPWNLLRKWFTLDHLPWSSSYH